MRLAAQSSLSKQSSSPALIKKEARSNNERREELDKYRDMGEDELRAEAAFESQRRLN